MCKLLEVKDLMVQYQTFSLHPLSFEMNQGEILTVIGESGSGKTTIAKAIACVLQENVHVEGDIILDGHSLLDMREKKRKSLRMSLFSVVLQNSVAWLNPTMTLRGHLQEVLKRGYRGESLRKRMKELMNQVGLEITDLERYPKELSGGMVQRFLLANALALSPKLVILDEPTSALDMESTEQFISLIHRLNQEEGTAFLLITHDLSLADNLSERMLVLYRGHLQEMGETKSIIKQPRHPYTRGLLRASTHMNLVRDLWGIRASEHSKDVRGEKQHGCPFYGRCTQSIAMCGYHSPDMEFKDGRGIACNRGGIVTLLEGMGIRKTFEKQQILKAIDFKIYSGEMVSIIGHSGVGKSTFANILGGFLTTEGGVITFGGERADYQKLYRQMGGLQMVKQDSQAALNPNMTVKKAVGEALLLTTDMTEEEMTKEVKMAMEDVELPVQDCFLNQKIHTLSGGEKQRVLIARALTMKPMLLIADEPTALLDVSSKANVLRMLKGLQNRLGISMLIITHDLECAFKISDYIMKLSDGRLLEVEPKEYVYVNKKEIYQ